MMADPLLTPTDYRFKEGDILRASIRASTTVSHTLFVRVRYADGTGDDFLINVTHSVGDRTNEVFYEDRPFSKPGWVELLSWHLPDSSIKRGQIYAMAFIAHGSRHSGLCTGYPSTPNHLGLGQFEDSVSGHGFVNWVQEADDIAGNVVDTTTFAAANTRRRVLAIIVKYHQAGGADATLTLTLRDMATAAGPTGWTIDSDSWVSPSLVLGAGQEGLIHVGEHGFVATNDAGIIAYADNTTAPNPFPFTVKESDTAKVLLAASGGASGDDYDVWVQYEEWIEE